MLLIRWDLAVERIEWLAPALKTVSAGPSFGSASRQ